MAQAARAYQRPVRAPESSPQIHVIPGRRGSSNPTTLPSSVLTLAKIFAVILVAFAVLAFFRIGLASATVTTALASEEVATEIEALRSEGSALEVSESNLSNPTHIKKEAAKLNMVAPAETTIVTLPKEVVATNEAGGLSLNASLKAATQV